jgi:serine/threonine protein kinase/Tol biopolymer transport system component
MSMIGKILAHYEITCQLGKGGMGEVYQAKDQKLGREVAIKVLPKEFAQDADRVARFQREAKLLASLNHPNIAAIYGLEESSGTNFLVLELVEGETLADQIKKGPIPVEEALKRALQIAEALEAAHEKGVIHRDLKPANIKVTPDGKVKVLDFGLAKAFAGEHAEVNLSNSPTLSNAATQQGVILGTAAYMSPEQARGESVDKKADIWAFGCVLYEMLTGRGMFDGRTVSDTLAAILMRDPEWKQLPLNLHPRIRLLLERCLEKEAKNRCSGIGDARADIQKALADPGGVFAQPITGLEPRWKLRMILPWVAAAVLMAVIAGVSVWILKPTPPPEAKRVIRFDYELPAGQQFNRNETGEIQYRLAVSPEGGRFVYGTAEGLYIRSMDALDARLIAGTDRFSMQPFFSPDGQWLGYWSANDQKLKKIALSGGAPVVLCDTGLYFLGASWSSNNTIVYSDILGGGVKRIAADGGTPESLIKANLADINKDGVPLAPQMLPDGNNLLFTNGFGMSTAHAQIVVQSIKSGKRKVLVEGANGRYLPSGHLAYTLEGNNIASIVAVPFDLDTLEVTGGPAPLIEGIVGRAFSDSGTLIYVLQPASAPVTSSGRALVWVDRNGKEETVAASPKENSSPNFSPDGTRVAISASNHIWILDLRRNTLTKLTFKGINFTPVWTPDGKRIVFGSMRRESNKNAFALYWKAADGTGEEEQLASFGGFIFPYCWSSDGKILIGSESPDGQKFDIWMLSLDGDRAPKLLLHEDYLETQPRLSRNGRWIAYTSGESRRNEVYVQSFPDVNKGRWQISTAGGDSPLWSPDGRELFYLTGDAVMAVSVTTEPSFSIVGTPRELFRGPYACPTKNIGDSIPWDISPDGKRFLMIKLPTATGAAPTAAAPRKINIVLNWFEELKQRVPIK